MTPGEKTLATALRDLCGWHVGMQLVGRLGLAKGGTVVQLDSDFLWVRNLDGREYLWGPRSSLGLPALDSPANWGHWSVEFQKLLHMHLGEEHQHSISLDLRLPERIVRCTRLFPEDVLPPSVLAWRQEHVLEAAAALPRPRMLAHDEVDRG